MFGGSRMANYEQDSDGKVHGKTIELDEDLGVAEGQEVESKCDCSPSQAARRVKGFLRTEGILNR